MKGELLVVVTFKACMASPPVDQLHDGYNISFTCHD